MQTSTFSSTSEVRIREMYSPALLRVIRQPTICLRSVLTDTPSPSLDRRLLLRGQNQAALGRLYLTGAMRRGILCYPAVKQIRPRLQHCSPLLSIFSLVVHRSHPALLVRQTFFYPVTVEPGFVQLRACRSSQVMYRERFEVVRSALANELDGAVDHAIQGSGTYRQFRLITARMQVRACAEARLEGDHDIEGLLAQIPPKITPNTTGCPCSNPDHPRNKKPAWPNANAGFRIPTEDAGTDLGAQSGI